MDAREFYYLLNQENINYLVERHYPVFKRILRECLGARNQKILIVGDMGFPEQRVPALVMACYLRAAKSLGLKCELAIQQPKLFCEDADDEIIEPLLKLGERNIIILALSGKIGRMKKVGRSFRKFIQQKKHRFVSTPSLQSFATKDFGELIKTLDVDYHELRCKGEIIKKILDKGKNVRITTRKGTDFNYSISGMNAINNSGIYKTDGLGGNLPAGEVYIASNNDDVSGTIVIDGSIKTNNDYLILKKNVKLTVENGSVVNIEGDEYALHLKQALDFIQTKTKRPENVLKIGELGIGTNPNAQVIGPTIINEKTLGTAHIALGSNHWFGGSIYAISHLDQVFYEPIIRVDGKVINGKLL